MVRLRAYEISEGWEAGTPEENWLHAEREFTVAHDYDTVERDLERLGMTLSRLPSEAGVEWRLTLPRGERVEAWEPGTTGLSPAEIMGPIEGARFSPAELAAPRGSHRKRFLADARVLQNLLGEHQDAVVAERALRRASVDDVQTAAAFAAAGSPSGNAGVASGWRSGSRAPGNGCGRAVHDSPGPVLGCAATGWLLNRRRHAPDHASWGRQGRA